MNLTDLKTPGVYVTEVPTFPPSVAEVATAVPAFIGYTAQAVDGAQRISTLLEFSTLFGGAHTAAPAVSPDGTLTPDPTRPPFLLYYCLRLYFLNGGGPCYVVSAGAYPKSPQTAVQADFEKALEKLAREDEPTLILMPDAVNLPHDAYYALCKQVLLQCHKLGDRFAIFDVREQSPDEAPTADAAERPPSPFQAALQARKAAAQAAARFRDAIGNDPDKLMYGAAYHPYLVTTLAPEYDEAQVTVAPGKTLSQLRGEDTGRYSEVKALLARQQLVLPPSAAIAGVYASVDRDRGVWKAPANVSLNAVVGPVTPITDADQEALNVHDTGKSINAIRAFSGRGTLVWGARTLAGNDNEWKYVSVRRLFNMIEESTRKATQFAVFEPNNATTWLKVKAMVESYLYGLWQQGAFMGASPEDAYFVHVGLGKTMTAQDVLEGRMIVDIGIAAVRPAEFIVLRFSHMLPSA